MTDGTALQKQGRGHRASPGAPSSVLTSCSPLSGYTFIAHLMGSRLPFLRRQDMKETQCVPHERLE